MQGFGFFWFCFLNEKLHFPLVYISDHVQMILCHKQKLISSSTPAEIHEGEWQGKRRKNILKKHEDRYFYKLRATQRWKRFMGVTGLSTVINPNFIRNNSLCISFVSHMPCQIYICQIYIAKYLLQRARLRWRKQGYKGDIKMPGPQNHSLCMLLVFTAIAHHSSC